MVHCVRVRLPPVEGGTQAAHPAARLAHRWREGPRPAAHPAYQDALVHVAVVHVQADANDAAVAHLLVVERQRGAGVAEP